MIKNLFLKLDISTEIDAGVSTGNKNKDKFYNELLCEVMKHDTMICDLFKVNLENDFNNEHTILNYDFQCRNFKTIREAGILKPAIDALSGEAKAYFLTILYPDTISERTAPAVHYVSERSPVQKESSRKKKVSEVNDLDEFLDLFFGQFGILTINKMDLIPREAETSAGR